MYETEHTPPLSVQAVVNQINHDMMQLETQLEQITEHSHHIYHKTTIIMRTVFLSIGVLTLLNFYFIVDFGKNIIIMIDSMQDMYVHFGRVTDEVDTITKDVVSMSRNVQLMPEISQKMTSMNHTVTDMTGSISGMQKEVSLMKRDVVGINHNMNNMSLRFVNVNHSMDSMVHQVDQMSRTIP
jgi:uncharacterized protein YoxC